MTEVFKDPRETQLGRIRALMAKTVENGCTEAEAKAAAAMVDALLAKYEIDLDEVALNAQKSDILEATVDGAEHPVVQACSGIAKFTDCRVWTVNHKQIVYFGFAIDTEVAEYLTHLFKRSIDREAAAFTLFNHDYNAATKAEKREMIRSFGIGMAVRLGDRLRELKSKRDWTAKEAGRDLVVLKGPLVTEAFAKLNMHFGKAKQMNARNRAAYSTGHNAGNNVAINQGIASRAARQQGAIR